MIENPAQRLLRERGFGRLPGEESRDLPGKDEAPLEGNAREGLSHVEALPVCVEVTVVLFAEDVVGSEFAREEAASQRHAGDDPDVVRSRRLQEVADNALAEQVEDHLQGRGRTVADAEEPFLDALDAGPVVADQALFLELLQILEGPSRPKGFGGNTVELDEIEAFDPKPREGTARRLFHALVGIVPVRPAAHLRRHIHPLLALAEHRSDEFLRAPGTVDIGRVDEVHPRVNGRVKSLARLPFRHELAPGIADRPGAKADFRYFEEGIAEGSAGDGHGVRAENVGMRCRIVFRRQGCRRSADDIRGFGRRDKDGTYRTVQPCRVAFVTCSTSAPLQPAVNPSALLTTAFSGRAKTSAAGPACCTRPPCMTTR